MNKFVLFLVGLFLVAPFYLAAQYPTTIHNEDLRIWLKSNLYNSQFSDLGYNAARQQMYSFTDEVNGKIQCIYTDFEMNAEFTTFPDPINAEHLVPQSFYGSTSPMRSDIHNLRPSHQDANSARSYFDFGEVPDAQSTWYGTSSGGAYLTSGSEPTNSSNFSEGIEFLWEPQEDRKGDVARGLFYFYTNYPTQAGPITDLASISSLYQWHLNDPTDAAEITRNARVETAQGNRNPYVDYPNLVYDAWLWVQVLGCIDDTASNYDPAANTDNGSCVYGNLGCTDPSFIEFDLTATIDDGSCIQLIVLGCRYANALNYNASANTDDTGSCIFPESCFGDFDLDGSITVSDLGGFLGAFGASCD